MGYKNLSASRGDGNYGHATHAGYSMSCIRTYLPREGTETCIASHSSFSIWILGIRTYLPREGTETCKKF